MYHEPKIPVKHNLKKKLILSLITFTIFSCHRPVKDGDYFPNRNGNWWKYKVFGTSGYIIREFSGTTRTETTTFQNWIKTYYDSTNQRISQDTNYILVNDTVVLYYEDLDEDPYVYLKFPLGVDSTWTFYVDEEQVIARVVTFEDNFSVLAGNFKDVYQICYNNPESEESKVIYYAPGVGIVKYSEYSDSDLDWEEELLEYRVRR